MVTIYYQYTEQVAEDRWQRVTRHMVVDCPELEALLKKGNDVVDAAVIAGSPQTAALVEEPQNSSASPVQQTNAASVCGLSHGAQIAAQMLEALDSPTWYHVSATTRACIQDWARQLQHS